MSVLLDTSFLIAYYDVRESNHKRAVEIGNNLEGNKFGQLLISDYILDETATLLKKYIGKNEAGKKCDTIINSTEMLTVNANVFRSSLELFKRRDGLSFTDCTNLILMRDYKIEHLATFDSGFTGLVNVLK